MRKFLFIALFLCSLTYGQDTIASIEEPVKYTVSDIVHDSSEIQQKTFDPKFKEKYRSEEFDYVPKKPEMTLWDRFKAWLGRLLANLFRMGGPQSLEAAGWIFRIVAVILIVVVIFMIVKAIMNKEGVWIFGRGTGKRLLSAEEIEKNIQAVDFEKLIRETKASGDKRLAVRYYYLWLLQRFSRQGLIKWDIEKTNSDYLYEIKNETDRKEFSYLSYLYNYIWYGEFALDDDGFEKAVSAFEKTLKRV